MGRIFLESLLGTAGMGEVIAADPHFQADRKAEKAFFDHNGCERERSGAPGSEEGSDEVNMTTTRIGRNDLCSCGSGKKYKKCHGVKTASNRQSKFLMIVVGGALVAALAAVVAQMTTDRRGVAERVWDPVHGHYHVNGREVP